MSELLNPQANEISPPILSADERRVVGVLAEKSQTTPDVYPLTVASLVAGCNQKSNRDPIVEYDADDVEATLESLRKKSLVIRVQTGGRVDRWKHALYDMLKLSKVEMAVIVELLLRGPQTEGELRGRASRMEPIDDLQTLEQILKRLESRRMIVYLSPPEQKRGVVLTHAFYPADELERVKRSFEHARRASIAHESDAEPTGSVAASASSAHRGPAARAEEVESLRDEVRSVREEMNTLLKMMETLRAELREFKSSLGA